MPIGTIFDIKRYAIHDGPGIRTTVFFKGCPLSCRWCHNPEGITPEPELLFREERCLQECEDCFAVCKEHAIVLRDGYPAISGEKCDLCGDCVEECSSEALEMSGREVDSIELLSEIKKDIIFYDESGGGVTFSGGEPLFQLEFLKDLLVKCKETGIHTAVDTSGLAPFSVFEQIMDFTDLFLYDIKTVDSDLHKTQAGLPNEIILDNLVKLCGYKKDVNIRLPLIPGINDSLPKLKDTLNFIKTLKNVKNISLLPYHNWGTAKLQRMINSDVQIDSVNDNGKNMDELRSTVESFGFNVNIGG